MVILLNLFRPAVIYPSIYAIDLDLLKKKGIKALIFDLDNTLVEWGSPVAHAELVAWFNHLEEEGFRACLLSNNYPPRVQFFATALGIPAIHRAGKPRRRSFRAALELLGAAPSEAAVIGDQLFTDVFGGNRLGLHTILVPPLSRREFIGTRLVRKIEALLLKHFSND